MPDDVLIDPNAPAAGSGTGAFRSVSPAGLNLDFDRWASPAVQGTKPIRLDEADACGSQVQRYDPAVGIETVEARRRRTSQAPKDDDEEDVGEDTDTVEWYLKSCKKRAVAAQQSGVWNEHDQQVLRDTQAKMAEDIDSYAAVLGKWAELANKPAESFHSDGLVMAQAAAVLSLIEAAKKSEADASDRSSAVSKNNQELVAKAELMIRERFQGSLYVCLRAADEAKGVPFDNRLKAAITAVNNQIRDIEGLGPVHTEWMNAASGTSKLDLAGLKALLKKSFDLWRPAQQKWLREKPAVAKPGAAGTSKTGPAATTSQKRKT